MQTELMFRQGKLSQMEYNIQGWHIILALVLHSLCCYWLLSRVAIAKEETPLTRMISSYQCVLVYLLCSACAICRANPNTIGMTDDQQTATNYFILREQRLDNRAMPSYRYHIVAAIASDRKNIQQPPRIILNNIQII